jgi:hypothetical protein
MGGWSTPGVCLLSEQQQQIWWKWKSEMFWLLVRAWQARALVLLSVARMFWLCSRSRRVSAAAAVAAASMQH